MFLLTIRIYIRSMYIRYIVITVIISAILLSINLFYPCNRTRNLAKIIF